MTFLVQDDAGSVAGANSYVDVDDFRDYHLDRGVDISIYADDFCERALVRATDYMDGRFAFIGMQASLTQFTKWPRGNAYDEDDVLRSGVPNEIKEACCEYAFLALTAELNPAPTLDATGRAVLSKRTVVGPIQEETGYAAGAAFKFPKYPKADCKIRPLTVLGGFEIVRS